MSARPVVILWGLTVALCVFLLVSAQHADNPKFGRLAIVLALMAAYGMRDSARR